MRKATLAGVINFCNVGGIEPNVLPLGEGGDFETQINQVEQKLQRTTRCIVTVIPRFCQMAVRRSFLYSYQLLYLELLHFQYLFFRQVLQMLFRKFYLIFVA